MACGLEPVEATFVFILTVITGLAIAIAAMKYLTSTRAVCPITAV